MAIYYTPFGHPQMIFDGLFSLCFAPYKLKNSSVSGRVVLYYPTRVPCLVF